MKAVKESAAAALSPFREHFQPLCLGKLWSLCAPLRRPALPPHECDIYPARRRWPAPTVCVRMSASA